MRTLHRNIIVLLLPLAFVGSASAQVIPPSTDTAEDLRGRIEAAAEWGVTKDLDIEAGIETRLNNHIGSVDRLHSYIGAKYEIGKYLDVGGDYILINIHDSAKGTWEKPRHRFNINAEGSAKVGNMEFALRERVQTTFRTDSVNRYEKPNPEIILRSRLTATYKIPHSRWSPYILFELYNTLNAPKAVANFKSEPLMVDNYITRYRAGVGAKYRADRDHRLDFYYYFDFDRNYNIDYKKGSGDMKGYVLELEVRHILGLSYKFKL